MIKRIIYVEDGSIDIDGLQSELTEETKIIVYRQGSIQPRIEELIYPIPTQEGKL